MTGPSQRLRITFAKGDAIRFCSHLDLLRVWVRALRRAGAPLAYSQGFHPRPRVQLTAALPLGYTGLVEFLDVWLERAVETAALLSALVATLPAGLTVSSVAAVVLTEPALQTRVLAADYLVAVEWDEPARAVEARLADVLTAEALPVERRGKVRDLRPLIERLRVERAGAGKLVLGMRLAALPSGTGRPEAVLEVLGMSDAFASYERQRLIFSEA